MTALLTPVLTANWGTDKSWDIDSYTASGGYGTLDKAFGMQSGYVLNFSNPASWSEFAR